jgi:hypothetical protein
MSQRPMNRLRSSGPIDFRSSHSARALQWEAEEDFRLGEYLRRKGADPFRSMRGGTVDYDPDKAKGVQARFGAPTVEDTRTWGNQAIIQFDIVGPEARAIPTTQLIHVARSRPTSFNILTVVLFGQGWDTENATHIDILYTVGVGQTQCQFVNSIDVAAPATGLSIFNTDQFPLNAVQTQVSINGTFKNLSHHMVTITQLAAPVFE